MDTREEVRVEINADSEAKVFCSYVENNWEKNDELCSKLNALLNTISVKPQNSCTKYINANKKGEVCNCKIIEYGKSKSCKAKSNSCQIRKSIEYGSIECLEHRLLETIKENLNSKFRNAKKDDPDFPLKGAFYRRLLYQYYTWNYLIDNCELSGFSKELTSAYIKARQNSYEAYVVYKLHEKIGNKSPFSEDELYDRQRFREKTGKKSVVKVAHPSFYILPEEYEDEYNNIIADYFRNDLTHKQKKNKEGYYEMLLFASFPLGINFYVLLKYNKVNLVMQDYLSISAENTTKVANQQIMFEVPNDIFEKTINWYDKTKIAIVAAMRSCNFKSCIDDRGDIKSYEEKKLFHYLSMICTDSNKSSKTQVVTHADIDELERLYNICTNNDFASEEIPKEFESRIDTEITNASKKNTSHKLFVENVKKTL